MTEGDLIVLAHGSLGPAFLGVAHSLSGWRWKEVAGDQRLATAIGQRFDLPEPVSRVLAARGIGLDEVEEFLAPRLRTALPDPFLLRDMEKAATRLAEAVIRGEPIGLFGDYDVDGATGTALMRRYLAALGVRSELHIPDRMLEGYGPNAPALLALLARGISLVVTIDCGTLSFEPLEIAAAAGMEVIVCDHHSAAPVLPRAIAVVNPNRIDETGAQRHMAAVGVTFLLVVAINRVLRAAGWFAGRTEPNPLAWLDIVALGTVCDVVPLVGVNRALVAQGLKVMAKRANPGLAALADIAKLTEAPEAWHLGYMLGPRINAGGRVSQSDLGSRLLSTDDPVEAGKLAILLDECNRERQQIEADILRQAIEQAETRVADNLPLVLVAGEGWHAGVVGIIASRLRERYNLPALVIALAGGQGTGSGRSVPGFDLGAAVIAAHQAGILIKGGGHAMAAGFTVAHHRMDELREFIAERMAAGPDEWAGPVLELDGALSVDGANLALAASLRQLGPFGSGNPEPRFAILGARAMASRVVGSGHVSCQLAGAGGGRLRAIAFRAADSELGQALLANDGTPLHVAGTLRLDSWQGENRAQLLIEDAAPAR